MYGKEKGFAIISSKARWKRFCKWKRHPNYGTFENPIQLYSAVRHNQYDMVRQLLDQYDRESIVQESLLFIGYFAGVKMLGLLLENGVNANEQDDIGNTVLNYAAMENNIPAMELLLQHGAIIDIPNVHGEDAFSFACVWGKLEAAKYLHEHGSCMTWVRKNWDASIFEDSSHAPSREIRTFLKEINLF